MFQLVLVFHWFWLWLCACWKQTRQPPNPSGNNTRKRIQDERQESEKVQIERKMFKARCVNFYLYQYVEIGQSHSSSLIERFQTGRQENERVPVPENQHGSTRKNIRDVSAREKTRWIDPTRFAPRRFSTEKHRDPAGVLDEKEWWLLRVCLDLHSLCLCVFNSLFGEQERTDCFCSSKSCYFLFILFKRGKKKRKKTN